MENLSKDVVLVDEFSSTGDRRTYLFKAHFPFLTCKALAFQMIIQWLKNKSALNRKLKIEALDRCIEYLSNSKESDYSGVPPEEVIDWALEAKRELQCKNMKEYRKKVGILLVPTGPAQDISIDNSWGNEYLEICAVLES